MKDKNGSTLTSSAPLQSVAITQRERGRIAAIWKKFLSLSRFLFHSFISFLCFSSLVRFHDYITCWSSLTIHAFLIDLFTSAMSMNRIKSKLDSVRISGKDEGMSVNRMPRKCRWISFTADTRGQQVKPDSNSQQLICDKCSAISMKNKCSYAYDNLAYGSSKDQRQLSEQWNKAWNTYLLLTHLFHCYCSMPEKHLNHLRIEKSQVNQSNREEITVVRQTIKFSQSIDVQTSEKKKCKRRTKAKWERQTSAWYRTEGVIDESNSQH